MNCHEIARQIDAHLKRFESDSTINAPMKSGTHPYFNAVSHASERGWVYVTYVSYQGTCCLRKSEAIKYLQWLDAGNIGQHWKAVKL